MLNSIRKLTILHDRKMRLLRYYCYHEIKHMCENRHRKSYIAWHTFKCIAYLYFVIRLFHVVAKIFEPNYRPQNDVIAHLFVTLDNQVSVSPSSSSSFSSSSLPSFSEVNISTSGDEPQNMTVISKVSLTRNNDRFFIITIAMLMLCSAALEVKIYFSPVDTIVFQMFYDFVVRLRRHYLSSKLSESERKSILEKTVKEKRLRRNKRSLMPHFYDVARAYSYIRREHLFYDKERLANAPLDIYHDMSLRLRFKMMNIMDSVEYMNFLQLITVFFGLTSFVVYNTVHLVTSLTPSELFFPLLELFFLGMVLSFVILLLILMSNFAFTSSMVFIEYISEVNVKLFQTKQENKRLNSCEEKNYRLIRASQKLLEKVFKSFMLTHVTISHQIQFANREEWSMVLLISILNHLPINAYLLYRFLTGTATVLSILLLISQWTFLLSVLAFLAYYSSVLHKSHSTLFAIQMYLSKRNILIKFKSLRMYELLNNKTKIGITIGPSPTISYTFVLEILIFYVGIILYMFKTMKKFG